MFEKYLYLADEMGEKYSKMFNIEEEDALQEARICLWEVLCRDNVRGKFETHFRRVGGKLLERRLALMGSCQVSDGVAILIAPSEEPFENQFFSSWDRAKVLELLETVCSDEEVEVISMKLGLNGDNQAFSEIGSRLGCPVNRVSHLYRCGLRKMYHASIQAGVDRW